MQTLFIILIVAAVAGILVYIGVQNRKVDDSYTKDELYHKAKMKHIEGRSYMNKQQLIDALNKK